MFATPRYVIKGGRVIVEDGELREAPAGDLLRVDRGLRRDDRAHPATAVRGALQRAARELRRARAVAAGARSQDPRTAHRERAMRLADTEVVDTFAEAFPMWGARIVITAESPAWAHEAARSLTGFATSVIGCKCEAGIERELDPGETPDGRPGVSAAAVRERSRGAGQAAGGARRPERAHLPDDGLLQRAGRSGDGRRRRSAALLRRRLPGQQGARRRAATGACR